MIQEYLTMSDLWKGAVDDLGTRGTKQPSRNGPTLEVVGWSGRILDPRRSFLNSPARKADPAFACAELLWYLNGRCDAEFMCHYAPQYAKFANPPTPQGLVCGAYGDRMENNPGFAQLAEASPDDMLLSQLEAVVELLGKRPDSRQGVVAMWDSGDVMRAIEGTWNDLPCTISMQFLLRDSRLHAVASMRSNDVWLGTPYDVFNFINLQKVVAHGLEVGLGTYTHHVGSLHAYEKDLPKIGAVDCQPSIGDGYPAFSVWPDPEAAIELAEYARLGKLTGEELAVWSEMHGGNPVGDAAVTCAWRWFKSPGSPPPGVSPALQKAWMDKYSARG